MGHMMRGVLGLVLLLAMALVRAETVTVGGVGSLTPLVRQLADQYMKQHPGVEIVVLHPPVGTGGGLRGLIARRLDVALTGRRLKGDEQGQVQPWLRTPLVLVTNGGKSTGLSRSQIAEIFAGRRTTWEDGKPIRLVLRGPQETETIDLRSISPEIDAAVGEALRRTDLPIPENDLEALETLSRIPGALGTSSLGLLKASESRLAALAIEGVIPDLSALESGRYPWHRQYFLVTRPQSGGAIADFVAFLQSNGAVQAARRLGYLPLKP